MPTTSIYLCCQQEVVVVVGVDFDTMMIVVDDDCLGWAISLYVDDFDYEMNDDDDHDANVRNYENH